jgi:hypothetical protein
MAQQIVFRDPALQAAREGGDIVDALADIIPAADQVLIDIAHRARIDVDGRVAAKEARKGAVTAMRSNFHARLQHRIA